jgi:hypothetical protein
MRFSMSPLRAVTVGVKTLQPRQSHGRLYEPLAGRPTNVPATFRQPHHFRFWLHSDGYLRLRRNGVLSGPDPHMGSSFDCSPDPAVYALRIIGEFTHYGRGLPESCAFMTVHVVVSAICATLLLSLAPPKAQAPDRPLLIL